MKDTTERVLLIQRTSDGLYWAPCEEAHTTSPGWAGDPADAKRFTPLDLDDLERPHNPDYYCENSPRMRRWLEGTQIVRAEIRTVVEVKFL